MIRLCHAFASLMDLYGSYANMKVLARRLEDSGLQVSCVTLPRFDGFDPDNTDMLFIGPGTELAAVKACEEISVHFDAISRFLKKGGTVLLCGNAAALFGRGITAGDASGKGLGIIDAEFTVSYRLRRYSEVLASGPWGETVGSVNTSCAVKWGNSPLFSIDADTDKLLGKTEGALSGNVYATEMIGPVLVNNPGMCDWFAFRLAGHELEADTQEWYRLAKAAHGRFADTLKETVTQ